MIFCSSSLSVLCGHERATGARFVNPPRPPSSYRRTHSYTVGRLTSYLSAASLTVYIPLSTFFTISSRCSTVVFLQIAMNCDPLPKNCQPWSRSVL
jgi:hypothetical protein